MKVSDTRWAYWICEQVAITGIDLEVTENTGHGTRGKVPQ
jgi:hypothetical protein